MVSPGSALGLRRAFSQSAMGQLAVVVPPGLRFLHRTLGDRPGGLEDSLGEVLVSQFQGREGGGVPPRKKQVRVRLESDPVRLVEIQLCARGDALRLGAVESQQHREMI